jgi:hypothetical protein
MRIGAPKDYETNKKDGWKETVDVSIPKEVLAKHGIKPDGTPMGFECK